MALASSAGGTCGHPAPSRAFVVTRGAGGRWGRGGTPTVQEENRTWNKMGTWWDRAAGKSAVGLPIKTPEKIICGCYGRVSSAARLAQVPVPALGTASYPQHPPGTRDEALPALSGVEHKHPRGFLLRPDIPGARGEGGGAATLCPTALPLLWLRDWVALVVSPTPSWAPQHPVGLLPVWGDPTNPGLAREHPSTGTGRASSGCPPPLAVTSLGQKHFGGAAAPVCLVVHAAIPHPAPIGVVWGSAAPRALAVTLGWGPAGPAASRGGEGHRCAPARALLPHGAPGIWALSFFPINPPLIAVLGSPC